MALYLLHRPAGRTDLKNTAGLHGTLVDAADAAAAANVLAPDLNTPFAIYTVVQIAAAAGGFVNCLIEGDVVGAAYADPRQGK